MKQYPKGKFRYMLFGRMAYEEAKLAFGTNAHCSTIHQLAYDFMIRKGSMKMLQGSNYLSWTNIPKYIKQPFGRTPEAFDTIREFCNSSSIDFKQYATNHSLDKIMIKFILQMLEAMYSGDMPCTHDIYLKCFHIALMTKQLTLDSVDILAIDECQDLSPIMLDLVKQYPAKVKVLVGDPYQAIFQFLGCVNAFEHFPQATQLHLSKTFRCSTELAGRISNFVQSTFDSDFEFVGTEYDTIPSTTRAYLTRTNNSMINKMIELNQSGTPYRLSTQSKLTQMFEWPLALLRCQPGNTERNPKFKPIQAAVDTWVKLPDDRRANITRVQFILQTFPENLDIYNAVRLNATHRATDVINAYNHAKEHQKSSANLQLMTIHTSKGSTVDIVELDDDVNESIAETMELIRATADSPHPYIPQEEELTELYLYYVAVSRSRHTVIKAKWL